MPLVNLRSRMAQAHRKLRHAKVKLCTRDAAMQGLLIQLGYVTTTELSDARGRWPRRSGSWGTFRLQSSGRQRRSIRACTSRGKETELGSAACTHAFCVSMRAGNNGYDKPHTYRVVYTPHAADQPDSSKRRYLLLVAKDSVIECRVCSQPGLAAALRLVSLEAMHVYVGRWSHNQASPRLDPPPSPPGGMSRLATPSMSVGKSSVCGGRSAFQMRSSATSYDGRPP